MDDLEAVSRESGAEQSVHQVLHLIDDLGQEGPAKERLGYSPVIGVFRRIGFDRQLAHAAQLLLGRNRHAKRGVGAEGLPVFGGGADILQPENHWDDFIAKPVNKDAV